MTKTHWLQNPNKNYFGHWDLPNGDDIILTIKSGNWEDVKDPTRGSTESKRIIRFEEKVKPFICNETNAEMIMKVTKTKFMEDVVGKQIQLYLSQTKFMREMVDCIRIRAVAPKLDSAKAIAKLNTSKTIEDLQKSYLGLTGAEKADKKVIELKNKLKSTLGK